MTQLDRIEQMLGQLLTVLETKAIPLPPTPVGEPESVKVWKYRKQASEDLAEALAKKANRRKSK